MDFKNARSECMLIIDSQKIQSIMFERHLGVNELAKAAKLNSTTISHVSRFDKKVTIKTVGKIATALKIEPETIIKSV